MFRRRARARTRNPRNEIWPDSRQKAGRRFQFLDTEINDMTPTASAQTRSRAWTGFAVILAFLGALAGSGSISAAPAFPVQHSANHRYLVDQNGAPFPILGRTAWFITSLSVTDYRMFIDDTVAKGFNAIEFHVVNHDPRGNNEPLGGNGAPPFTKKLNGSDWAGSLSYGNINNDAPDFSLPNETYWTHVDALLAYAESKGVLCFMFPAYTGWQGGDQGWMQEMVANGTTRMRAYGAFIANRYKTRGNIVWMLGGDYSTTGFTAPQLAVEQSMLAGMQSVGGQSSIQFSAEWSGNSIYTDQADPTLRAAGTLQGAYSWEDPTSYVRNGYNHSPVMPTFLLEEPYDEEGPDGLDIDPYSTQPVRRYQWWGWLSGIGGYIAGNGYIWPFNDGWKLHLNTQGAQDMARLNAFIKSIAWYNLVPSELGGMRTLITAGGNRSFESNYVAAAATPDGKLLIAYVPPNHSGPITIDMTAMSGLTRARWYNPASAVYTLIGTFANTGTSSFTPPGDNGTGFNDWVLVLQVGATRVDFNGDGKTDILWRNTSTGDNYIYFMDGTTVLGTSGYTYTVPLVWTVGSTADFNGDGKADILWRNTSTGDNYIYFMDGTTVLGTSGYTATVPLNWSVVNTR